MSILGSSRSERPATGLTANCCPLGAPMGSGLCVASQRSSGGGSMSVEQFCSVENRPIDDADLASSPNGTTIHVTTESVGHTLDGWRVSYKANRKSGRWTLTDIK